MASLRARLDRLTGSPPAAFWWLWGGALVSALATFVLPFLTLYLRSRGFGVEAAGRAGALYGVGVLLSSPVAGSLADRLGRRPTMIGALLCTAAATALLAVVTAPAALAGAVLLVGVSLAAYRPAAMALIADVVPPAARTRAYGMLRWGNNLGLAVSSVLGGALAAAGFGRLFLVDASTTFAFALIVAAKVPETRPARPASGAALPGPGLRALLRDRTLLAFLALQLAFILPLWQFQVTLPVAMAAEGHGPAVFGRVLAVNGVLIALLQPSVAAWTAVRDPARFLATGMLLVGLGYGAYAFCHGALAFGLATGVWSLGGDRLHARGVGDRGRALAAGAAGTLPGRLEPGPRPGDDRLPRPRLHAHGPPRLPRALGLLPGGERAGGRGVRRARSAAAPALRPVRCRPLSRAATSPTPGSPPGAPR